MPSRAMPAFVQMRRVADRRGLLRISPRVSIIPHGRVPPRSILLILLLLRPDQHPYEEQEGDHRRVFDHRGSSIVYTDRSPSSHSLRIEQTLAQLSPFILPSFLPSPQRCTFFLSRERKWFRNRSFF